MHAHWENTVKNIFCQFMKIQIQFIMLITYSKNIFATDACQKLINLNTTDSEQVSLPWI